jgi:molybdopterin synthase catalytic subunit
VNPSFSIRLLREPLDVAAAAAHVRDPSAGGIDIFIGTTRSEDEPARGPLVALDYHAYDEMAMRHMQKLADTASARWPICRLALWHRLGEVRIGEPSVIIAVSCPHRAAAFEACRFLIDELKQSVPIWKKEMYAKDSRWQGEA